MVSAIASLPNRHLHHIHLPYLTSYLLAAKIQDHYVRLHLDDISTSASTSSFSQGSASRSSPINPVLLTFQTPPTYTCGRREVGALSASQIVHLRYGNRAAFHEALRGGQTTFHGPGQLTAYLICHLKAHDLTPRSYVQFLERSVIELVGEYGLQGHTREEYQGVWVGKGGGERKIASLGVHLRRYVSSHGVGLNVGTNLGWFKRIEACGLPGEFVTSMLEQGVELQNGKALRQSALDPEDILQCFEGGEDNTTEADEVRQKFRQEGSKVLGREGRLLNSIDLKKAVGRDSAVEDVLERSQAAMRSIADQYALVIGHTLPNIEGRVKRLDLPTPLQLEAERDLPKLRTFHSNNIALGNNKK